MASTGGVYRDPWNAVYHIVDLTVTEGRGLLLPKGRH